jgi:shikimate kinase
MHDSAILRGERVFLTGFMGSGKSTIGPILANTLGWSFVDLDHAIEVSAGRTITEIFGQQGEPAFREIERNILGELAAGRHTVIALGGGTIADERNFKLVSRNGILVYLKIPPEQLIHRLKKKTNRPMLAGQHSIRLDDTTLQSRVVELHRIREPFYNMADVVVETGVLPVGPTVDEVVRKLSPFLS